MNNQLSLYIDHQSIAPLVRLLEGAVSSCQQRRQGQSPTQQVRMELYKRFVSIMHTLYLERNPHLKNEDGSIKLEAIPEIDIDQLQCPNIEGLIATICTQAPAKKLRGPSARSLEVQAQLIEWIKSCDTRIFEKKEIDAKYQELLGDSKRILTIKKIKELVEKFEIPALIVKTRNKQEHFFGANLNVSVSTIPKAEEQSPHSSLWFDDDHETVKNSYGHVSNKIKEESHSDKESQSVLDLTQPKYDNSSSKQHILEEESCGSIFDLESDE